MKTNLLSSDIDKQISKEIPVLKHNTDDTLFPKKKFDLIYADPPWKHDKLNFYEKKGVNREVYPRMEIEDICKLPVKRIAKDNSVLLMWVTSPFLKKAFKVIEDWGFQYCTIAFVWIKTYKSGKEITGMGRYTRSACEYILLAKRGIGIHRKHTNIHQVVFSPLQDHSRKPEEIRRRIEVLFGNIERIELFARGKFKGWNVWGNQIPTEQQNTLNGDGIPPAYDFIKRTIKKAI